MKNIVYIVADQLRWDALPCNGGAHVQAPNFDRLAREGTNFTCAYSGNPVCVPARGVLATGCYSHRCMDSADGGNGGRIVRTHIAAHARAAGYATYGVGKFHYLPYKANPGFDVFELAEEGRIAYFRGTGQLQDEDAVEDYLAYLDTVGYGGYQRAHGIGNNDPRAGRSPLPAEHYVDAWATSRSLALLDAHRRDRSDEPFFLQLGWVKPHAPYDPPAPYDTMYDPRQVPPPWGGPEDFAGRNPMMPTFRLNYLVDQLSDAAVQYARAHYFGLVSFLDHQLGRLLDYLDARGLADNTVVVVTADHGDNLGDHGVFFKSVLTEGSAHVPLLIRDAAPSPVHRRDEPVGQEDVVPTLCELAGLPPIDGVDGRSVAPLMRDPAASHKPFAVSQHGAGDRMTLMLRGPRYKYCFARYEATEELYDLEADPHELHNLVGRPEHADLLREHRDGLNQWCLENDHEPLLDTNGVLWGSPFTLADHLVEPTRVLGIRPD